MRRGAGGGPGEARDDAVELATVMTGGRSWSGRPRACFEPTWWQLPASAASMFPSVVSTERNRRPRGGPLARARGRRSVRAAGLRPPASRRGRRWRRRSPARGRASASPSTARSGKLSTTLGRSRFGLRSAMVSTAATTGVPPAALAALALPAEVGLRARPGPGASASRPCVPPSPASSCAPPARPHPARPRACGRARSNRRHLCPGWDDGWARNPVVSGSSMSWNTVPAVSRTRRLQGEVRRERQLLPQRFPVSSPIASHLKEERR